MAIQTKEELLTEILSKPKQICRHCGKEMSLWEAPMMDFSDGLGWGAPYLYVCFNNACPPFVNGWDEIGENYAHKASTRCLCYPGTDNFEFMPVFSKQGGTAQIIDEDILKTQAELEEQIKAGFLKLAECYAANDHAVVLEFSLDASKPARVRAKALEMIGDIGVLEALEPLINLKLGNNLLEEKRVKAIRDIHKRTFTKECPFCAEIVKSRAKICKQCGKDIAGI